MLFYGFTNNFMAFLGVILQAIKSYLQEILLN